MKDFICLLRGINVGGNKIIKMKELVVQLEKSGLKNVKTHIQSGNIYFESEETDLQNLQHLIFESIQNHWGFEVSVLVLEYQTFKNLVENRPYPELPEGRSIHFNFFQDDLDSILLKDFLKQSNSEDELIAGQKIIYLICDEKYSKTKFTHKYLEKSLENICTTRNLNTSLKLIALKNK